MSSQLTYVAAIMMMVTTILHIYMGRTKVLPGMLQTEMHPRLLALSLILFRAVTVTLATFTVALWHLATHPNLALEATVAAVQLGYVVLFLFYGASRLNSVWLMPQWVIFLAIPAITRLGQYQAG